MILLKESVSKQLTDILNRLRKKTDLNSLTDAHQVTKEIHNLLRKIKQITTKRCQDKYPALLLETISSNGSVSSVYESDPKQYFYSRAIESRGRLCGKRHSVVFRVSAISY